LHFSSSWVKIRLHTENQLPMLPGSALKVPVGGWGGVVGSYPLSSQAPTPVEVELGCDNIGVTANKNMFSNNVQTLRGVASVSVVSAYSLGSCSISSLFT
jgi:hypothetical protein